MMKKLLRALYHHDRRDAHTLLAEGIEREQADLRRDLEYIKATVSVWSTGARGQRGR